MMSPPLLPDARQMDVEFGLAEVSPVPPVTPATGPDAVADGELTADGEVADPVVAVGAAVAGLVTEAAVLPHPATARAAAQSTHAAFRVRARPTRGPSNLEIRSLRRGGPLPPGAGRRQGYHPSPSTRGGRCGARSPCHPPCQHGSGHREACGGGGPDGVAVALVRLPVVRQPDFPGSRRGLR